MFLALFELICSSIVANFKFRKSQRVPAKVKYPNVLADNDTFEQRDAAVVLELIPPKVKLLNTGVF